MDLMLIQEFRKDEHKCLAQPELWNFFSCFPAAWWRKYTNVRNIRFSFSCTALCHYRLEFLTRDGAVRRSIEGRADSAGSHSLAIDPEDDDIVLIRPIWSDPAAVMAVRYETDHAPVTSPSLALVIVSFHRTDILKDNLQRLMRSGVLGPSDQVFIIDQAGELTEDEVHGCRLVRQRNLGGSGGFARGMHEARREGRFSHIMLMDDDIVLLPSMIARARAALAYSTEPRLALSGGMLRMDAMSLQHEAGARFAGGRSVPLKHGLDMKREADVIRNSDLLIDVAGRYGAWWFFAAPMPQISTLPFPFFLRGDDALFSIENRFEVTDLPALVVWHPPLNKKQSPALSYYNCRNLLLVSLIQTGRIRLRDLLTSFFFPLLTSLSLFKYETARALCDGCVDFCAGPDFWLRTDGETFHGTLSKRQDGPRIEMAGDLLPPCGPDKGRSFWSQMAGLVTLCVPQGLASRTPKLIDAEASGPGVTLSRRIVLFDRQERSGLVVDKDSRETFAILARSINLICHVMAGKRRLEVDYLNARPKLGSTDYWTAQWNSGPDGRL